MNLSSLSFNRLAQMTDKMFHKIPGQCSTTWTLPSSIAGRQIQVLEWNLQVIIRHWKMSISYCTHCWFTTFWKTLMKQKQLRQLNNTQKLHCVKTGEMQLLFYVFLAFSFFMIYLLLLKVKFDGKKSQIGRKYLQCAGSLTQGLQ